MEDRYKNILSQLAEVLPTLATKADIAALNNKVDVLNDKVDALADELRGEIAALKGKVAGIDAKVDSLAADSFTVRTTQAVMSARLDEQRQTINAMIPTQLAAVPPVRAVG